MCVFVYVLVFACVIVCRCVLWGDGVCVVAVREVCVLSVFTCMFACVRACCY